MKPTLKIKFIIATIISMSFDIKAQISDSRYVVETTLDNKTPVVYEDNRGAFKFNINTGDLLFVTNLSNFKTGNKTTDSLLSEQEVILFTFSANTGQNLSGLIDQQNDDKYHSVTGIITVNNVTYNKEGFYRLKNLSERSNLSKVLVDLKLEIDPKVIKLPYLSDYFKNTLIFEVEDNFMNQNK